MTFSKETIRPLAVYYFTAAIMLLCIIGITGCAESGTTIRTESTPTAAKVYIDGQYIGLTPCEYFIANKNPQDKCEKNVLEVFAKGYQPARKTLSYKTGTPIKPNKFSFVLKPDDTALEFVPYMPASAKMGIAAKTGKPKPNPKKAPAKKVEKAKPAKPVKIAKKSTPKKAEKKKINRPAKVAKKNKSPKPPAIKAKPVKVAKKVKPKKAALKKRPVKIAKKTKKKSRPVKKQPKTFAKVADEEPVAIEIFDPPKEYDDVSPWRQNIPMCYGKKYKAVATKTKIAKKTRKYDNISPWRKNATLPSGWEVNYKAPTSSPTKKGSTQCTPWTKAQPNWVNRPHKTNPKYAATPPRDDRLLTCEIRIARVRDGKVIAQASGVDHYKNIDNIAMSLIAELAGRIPSQSKVAVFCLNNRKKNLRGQLVTQQMQKAINKAVHASSRMQFTREIDIRDSLDKQNVLEIAKLLTAPKFFPLIGGSDYVILGGIALYDNTASPQSYRSSKSRQTKLAKTK